MKKKTLSVMLSVTMMSTLLAGCSSKKKEETASTDTTPTEAAASDNAASDNAAAKDSTEEAAGSKKYEKFLTVDVFDGQANYMGISSGWFAEIIKQKFNMELNIIAPNVAGGGDTLYQTRSAAGDLGDLILMTSAGGRLQNLVDSGLVVDLSQYLPTEQNLSNYMDAITYTNKKMCTVDGQWCVPSEVSSRSADTMLGGTEPNSACYVRWDLYKQLGYPEINTFEDLLPLMKQMMELCPTSDSGKPTYAFSLFKDWDGDSMAAAGWMSNYYGYSPLGYAIASADDSLEPQSCIDDNSVYIRGLKFWFDANQMGLLDPESTTQNFDTLNSKYKDGQILWDPWPWLGQSAYNTSAHLNEGKGFMPAEIKDQKLYAWGCYSKGNPNNAIMVGSKADDPQRMVDFIDWLYSPEGICLATGQTSGSCGPRGLTWDMVDGKPQLTDFGKQAYIDDSVEMPAEYGGGKWSDGISQLNYKTVSDGEINPETGFPYNYVLWDSFISTESNPVKDDWKSFTNATNTVEFFQSKNEFLVSAGSGYATPEESSDIAAIRSQCKSIVTDYSWQAVFAKDEAEFKSLVQKMQEACKGLGYDQVLEYDMQNVADQKAQRQEVLN